MGAIKKIVVTEFGRAGTLTTKTTYTLTRGIEANSAAQARDRIWVALSVQLILRRNYTVEWTRAGRPEGYANFPKGINPPKGT